jgi:glycosyltransferase involved in cell wall biosynthesis
MGKGAAVQTGISASTGDIVLVQDADMEYLPEDIPRLVQPILDDKADVVLGSRFLSENTDMSCPTGWGIRFLVVLLAYSIGVRSLMS